MSRRISWVFVTFVPWTKGQQLSTGHEAFDSFYTLHREMNRLFDDVAVSVRSVVSAAH
jgi:hypothetical protein